MLFAAICCIFGSYAQTWKVHFIQTRSSFCCSLSSRDEYLLIYAINRPSIKCWCLLPVSQAREVKLERDSQKITPLDSREPMVSVLTSLSLCIAQRSRLVKYSVYYLTTMLYYTAYFGYVSISKDGHSFCKYWLTYYHQVFGSCGHCYTHVNMRYTYAKATAFERCRRL